MRHRHHLRAKNIAEIFRQHRKANTAGERERTPSLGGGSCTSAILESREQSANTKKTAEEPPDLHRGELNQASDDIHQHQHDRPQPARDGRGVEGSAEERASPNRQNPAFLVAVVRSPIAENSRSPPPIGINNSGI